MGAQGQKSELTRRSGTQATYSHPPSRACPTRAGHATSLVHACSATQGEGMTSSCRARAATDSGHGQRDFPSVWLVWVAGGGGGGARQQPVDLSSSAGASQPLADQQTFACGSQACETVCVLTFARGQRVLFLWSYQRDKFNNVSPAGSARKFLAADKLPTGAAQVQLRSSHRLFDQLGGQGRGCSDTLRNPHPAEQSERAVVPQGRARRVYKVRGGNDQAPN